MIRKFKHWLTKPSNTKRSNPFSLNGKTYSVVVDNKKYNYTLSRGFDIITAKYSHCTDIDSTALKKSKDSSI